MNLDSLKNEIDSDPLGRGYVGMTDQEVADSLHMANRTVYRPVPSRVLQEWASVGERIVKLKNAAATHASDDVKNIAESALLLVRVGFRHSTIDIRHSPSRIASRFSRVLR